MLPYDIVWRDEAKLDVRALDRATAMRVFDGILHFSRTGSGDIKILQGHWDGRQRLRVGDYRVIFSLERKTMQILAVRHRSEAYR